MENESKTISIIIPVYNAEKYIVNTIETAETQEKYVDYEIVIVNDGSTDSSKKQVEDLIKAAEIFKGSKAVYILKPEESK